jgi:uncharacterized SAM-dependent methyltransferase
MHLVPRARQHVRLARPDLALEIAAGESIWTESSYKFTPDASAAMLHAARLRLDRWITDREEQFALLLASPAAQAGIGTKREAGALAAGVPGN